MNARIGCSSTRGSTTPSAALGNWTDPPTHLEDPAHDSACDHRWTFWEATDQLVEELLGADLKMDGVAAVLDQVVKNIEREKGLVRIARVDMGQKSVGRLASAKAGISISC